MEHVIRRGEEVQLEISASAYEGKSVARIGNFVILVDGAVPGDSVRARIVKTKKNYAEARTLEILQPSSLRVQPRCPSVGVCGGCKWQHVDYSAQLRFKEQHVQESFRHIGGFESIPIAPIIGADDIYFYRNKMEFSFSDQEWLETAPVLPRVEAGSSGLFLGLHVPQRYDKVLDISECSLQSETSNKILNFTREFARTNNLAAYSTKSQSGFLRFLVIRQSKRTQQLMVNLVTFENKPEILERYVQELCASVEGITTVVNTINSRKAQIAYGESEIVCMGPGTIREQLGDRHFEISAGSFFQTNTEQAEKLFQVARDFARLKKTDTVFDLYSGTGSIALFIADQVRQVVGVESAESAIRDAEKNAALNNITNCKFIHGDLKDRLVAERDWISSVPQPDVLIIDPPRSGMHPKIVEEIIRMKVDRIVYVSCNPATQARDVKILCQSRYALRRLQPVDMFPHTYHIENVALLELQPTNTENSV